MDKKRWSARRDAKQQTAGGEFKNKQKTIDEMVSVIKSNDATYSPLALYHLLDSNLLEL